MGERTLLGAERRMVISAGWGLADTISAEAPQGNVQFGIVLFDRLTWQQQFLMDTNPDAFFLTDHYRGYPTILIRLSKVPRGQLQELLDQSWRRLAPKKLLAEHDAALAATKPAARKKAVR